MAVEPWALLTDWYNGLLGYHVILQRWDFLKHCAQLRRDADIKAIHGKSPTIFVPKRGPAGRIFERHQTLVVCHWLRVGLCKNDHAVLAEDASTLPKEQRVITDLFGVNLMSSTTEPMSGVWVWTTWADWGHDEHGM